jgi:hypothetical protein
VYTKDLKGTEFHSTSCQAFLRTLVTKGVFSGLDITKEHPFIRRPCFSPARRGIPGCCQGLWAASAPPQVTHLLSASS